MIKIRDLIVAEEAVEAAETAYRTLNDDVSAWSAFESMDKQGKRTLNVSPLHFERRDAARAGIATAQQQLLAAKRAFLEGVVDRAEI